MAKVREMTANGCVVTGSKRLADGSPDSRAFVVQPDKPMVYQGRLIGATPITVTPDGAGNFSITLPPGLYTVDMPGAYLRIDVPATATARLEEILLP